MKRLVRGATPFGAARPNEDEIAAGLLAFRNTARYGGRSPAELVFGRPAREGLPMHWRSLEDPRWATDPQALDNVAEKKKERLADHYDSTAKALDPFPPGTPVAVMQEDSQGRTAWPIKAVVVETKPKHQYVVRQDNGRLLERNRVQLRRRYTNGQASGESEPAQELLPPLTPLAPPPPALTQAAPPAPPPTLRKSSRVRKKNRYYVGDAWTM
jgi:hypothetical protein